MISYAVAAFAYRLTLYCGIALMMYHWVAKVVGIVLMVTALFVFLVQPVVNELTAVTKLRGLIRLRPRLVLTMIGLIALLLWLALPLPRRCSAPACTIARSTQVIYTPHAGTIAQIAIQPGQHVESGDMVLQLTSDQLDADQRIAELAHERLELELTAIRAVPESRSLLPEKAEALARAEARIRSLTETRSGYSVRAAVSGNVEDLDEHLQPGMAVPAGYHCGRITTPGIPHAVAYITEARAEDLQVDDEVTFISNAQPMRVTGRVLFVEAVQAQNIEQLALTSLTGGPIAVTRDARGKAVPNQAYYRAEIELTTPAEDMRFDQAGRIWFRTKPKSYLADLFSYLYRIVIRESGL
jgi:putative peptide zinc metalloprotease protein